MKGIRLTNFTKISTFFIFAVSIIFLSYCFTDSSSVVFSNQYRSLNFSDAIFIFLINFFNILILLAFSWMGLPVVYSFSFLLGIGRAGAHTDVSPTIYFGSSIIHGLLELFVIYLVLDFTFKQFNALYFLFKNGGDTYKLKNLYIHLLKKRLPLILLILIIASLVEVYISNSVFLSFIEK